MVGAWGSWHTASTQETGRPVLTLSSLAHFTQAGASAHREAPPTLRVKPLEQHPYVPTQKCVSMVILNLVKVTVKVSHRVPVVRLVCCAGIREDGLRFVYGFHTYTVV